MPPAIDLAAKEIAAYLESLQRPNELFYHAPDVPFLLRRGNGWVAAGITEMLRFIPEDNPYRQHVLWKAIKR